MATITPNKIEAGCHVTAFATPDPATGPPGDIVLDHDAANAGDFRPEFRQRIEAALARIERAVAGVVHGLRDGLARRQTVRELHLLGRSRLVDLGIEPDRIEHLVDTMIAARRGRPSMRGTGLRPRSE